MRMIELEGKKKLMARAVSIGVVFLAALAALFLVAYYVLYQNFQSLLTDYSLKMIQTMADQGVTTVEYELHTGQQEAAAMAKLLVLPQDHSQAVVFPETYDQSDVLRMVYTTPDTTVASDNRRRSIAAREDVVKALGGETAVYGPFFNEENEYVVCYTAPVYQNGAVVGALSLEKDGYRFCELIRDIQFVQSGESYIINADDTDIAVSDMNHIDWVNSQYNARSILAQGEDADARSVIAVEEKGLAGESGIDTGNYTWEGNHYYLVYEPIPSTGWVLIAGVREEELAAMNQSTLRDTFVKGPALGLCTAAFLLLTAGLFLWILSSVKRNAEMARQLEHMASCDALTGLKNRNSYHHAIERLDPGEDSDLACVYVDANGLHEINNHLGHQAGDTMLRAVADALRQSFDGSEVYRIGGDEFVVLSQNAEKQDVWQRTAHARLALKEQGYEISVGIGWRGKNQRVEALINDAEAAMQRDKERYYRQNGKERQLRTLDRQLEQFVIEKQDADAFLNVLAPEFNGVYFVDLGTDTVRHIFIPPYFEAMLEEAGDVFSQAMQIYADRMVTPPYREAFRAVCDYTQVEKQLSENRTPKIVYQKTDGDWIRLRILKFKSYTQQSRETLWIFSNIDRPRAKEATHEN